jgi:hypothetical protein
MSTRPVRKEILFDRCSVTAEEAAIGQNAQLTRRPKFPPAQFCKSRLPAASVRRPSDYRGGNDLLVIADATPQIADLGYQAYLCNRCRVGARLRKHVADLSDLTILCPVVESLTKHLACGIF